MPTSNTTAINFIENGIPYINVILPYQFIVYMVVHTVVHTVVYSLRANPKYKPGGL